VGPLEGSLGQQGRVVLEALSDGRVTPEEAVTLLQAIWAQARIVEVDELEARVAALEGRDEKAREADREP
jgi:hypothetical protein